MYWVTPTEDSGLKRAAVRWLCVAYAAEGINYHTWLFTGLRGHLSNSSVI